jgi:hypothetical protein
MEPDAVFKSLQDANAREQERIAQAAIETQVKVLSATFDKSVAYTNLVILAAYAGYFGLWQLTKEYLTKEIALWSALLMLVSVIIFVAFEIIKMVVIQHNVIDKAKVLRLPEVQRDPHALEKAFRELGAVHERVLYHFMRIWVGALIATVFTGMAAASLLGYAFVAGIAM